MKDRAPRPVLPERNQTVRKAILEHLQAGPKTTRELSQLLRIEEKSIVPHLEHLQKSLRHAGERLKILPAGCQQCGFRFEDRRRLSRPGSCPRCQSQRIEPPAFQVVDPKTGA